MSLGQRGFQAISTGKPSPSVPLNRSRHRKLAPVADATAADDRACPESSPAATPLPHARSPPRSTLRGMVSAELNRRVGRVVGYPPLSDLDDLQRREFHEALLRGRHLRGSDR